MPLKIPKGLYLRIMKRRFLLFSFFLVMFSLAANIVADVFLCGEKVEMIEKDGKEGKEVDHESDFKKDKIFQNNIIPQAFLNFRKKQSLHPPTKISSLALGTEINPPDIKCA